MGFGRTGWKAAWWKGTLVCWWTVSWIWTSSVHRWPRRPMASWLVSGVVWWAGLVKSSCPVLFTRGLTSSAVFSFGNLSKERTLRSKEGQQSLWGVWRTLPTRSNWGNWGCLVWGKGGWGETLLFSSNTWKVTSNLDAEGDIKCKKRIVVELNLESGPSRQHKQCI